MALVFANFGALSGAPEVTYGVEVVPTEGILVEGQPEYTFDSTFAEREYLALGPSAFVAPRQNNKLDISFAAVIGPMEDISNGSPAVHPVLIAGGAVYTGDTTPGTGNFAQYRPGGTGSSTLYGYFTADGGAGLSILKHIGTRLNWTLSLEPGSDLLLNAEGSALYAFPLAFNPAAVAPTRVGKALGPWPANCISATIDGETVPIVSFEFTPNNEIGIEEDAITACADGASEILLTPAPMTGTLTLKWDTALTAASGDNWIRQFNDTEADYQLIITRDDGGTQTFTFTIPKFRPRALAIEDGDTRKNWTIEFVALPTTGNDEYTMRWDVV